MSDRTREPCNDTSIRKDIMAWQDVMLYHSVLTHHNLKPVHPAPLMSSFPQVFEAKKCLETTNGGTKTDLMPR